MYQDRGPYNGEWRGDWRIPAEETSLIFNPNKNIDTEIFFRFLFSLRKICCLPCIN